MSETPNKKPAPKARQRKPMPKREKLPNVGPLADQQDVKPNKYAPKEKIGTPTLGRSDNYVTKVGLGNLKTITYGNTDV